MMVPANVHFTRATDADVRDGLLGFVRFSIGPLRVDGVTLRRTRGGRLALSSPCRRDRAGRYHALMRPVNARARRLLEAQVLHALQSLNHE